MEDNNIIRVTAPIFLLRSTESCWHCHASPEVLMVPASELSEGSLVPTDYMASFRVGNS